MDVGQDLDNYVMIRVCLPCSHGECFACYGEGCECRCGGEDAGQPAPNGH